VIKIHSSAQISESAEIGEGTRIWNFAQIREHCKIGLNVIIGRNVYVGEGVSIGDNSKVQNSAMLYEPASLESGVFIGPGVILTNDQFPRAINPDRSQKTRSDWESVGVLIREGASIGAGSICIAPIEIGAWALVAAGSVVTRNVPPFALVAGNPARRIKWVGRAGIPLRSCGGNLYECPKTGQKFLEIGENSLEEVSA
jgi:UDP-2-acetamido-3-amino-2,3-dideoxy-glucuronate N-acetyltransferase